MCGDEGAEKLSEGLSVTLSIQLIGMLWGGVEIILMILKVVWGWSERAKARIKTIPHFLYYQVICVINHINIINRKVSLYVCVLRFHG